jgi:hypothetical protein
MNALRPDGTELLNEWRGDPDRPKGHLVRARRALMPHDALFRRGAIDKEQHDAADRYLRHYQIGICGARNALDPGTHVQVTERFHEARMHHACELGRARDMLRPHERAVLDAVVVAGMTLDAYAVEVLRLTDPQTARINTVKGRLCSALDTLSEFWGMKTVAARITLTRL